MTTRRDSRPSPEDGFTLVEVLVAFTVATLFLGVVYTAFSQGLRSSLVAQHARDAALLVQSSVDAEIGVPLRAKRIEDNVGPFERVVLVEPRPDLVAAGAQLGVVPYEISVRIAWRDGGGTRTASLSTLWLGPR